MVVGVGVGVNNMTFLLSTLRNSLFALTQEHIFYISLFIFCTKSSRFCPVQNRFVSSAKSIAETEIGHWYKRRRVKAPKWNIVELHILVFWSLRHIHDSLLLEYDFIDSW